MKSSKKKLIIALVSVFLVIALATVGISYAVKNSGKPVKVAPVSNMNNGGYWDNGSDLSPYGNVTTNLNQEIAYNESLVITEIYVKEGDSVKVGDPLIAYDTTLASLELEMKEMEVEGIGLNIQNVQAELDQLKKTKPVAAASPNALSGMGLATGDPLPPESSEAPTTEAVEPTQAPDVPDIPDRPETPTEPGNTEPPTVINPTGNVYGEITDTSEAYAGDGSEENPFRYYIYSTDGKPVTVSQEYLALCLRNHVSSVFDTVDNPSAPTAIVSSFRMDWDYIAGIMEGTNGTKLPEELRGETVYGTIDENTIPYNLEEAGGIPAGDGSKENPYRILCIPGVNIERSFLEAAMESQLAYRFDVVDDGSAPNCILHSWLLNGAVVEDPEDPGMDDPGIGGPGIEIPTGPTKEELAGQIKEKEETLKNLELNKRTAELELKQLRRQVDDGVIESTVDGTVKSVLDEDTAKLEGSPLIRVTGEEGFYITGSVAETALGKIEKGMPIHVSSWNTGMSYDAEITGISSSPSSNNYYGGNPNMSYYPFTAVIRGDADLSNGEGVDLSMDGLNSSSYDPDAIYLSQAFVREEGARYYVYKKGEDDKLTKQYVEVGKIVYGSLEITSGLTIDDEIAFPYGRDVKEGAKTEPADTLYDYGY